MTRLMTTKRLVHDSTDAEAEAEQAEENEHDDVADTADTDTADAKENHNPQH